jgi:hypothetical protein
MGGGYTCLEVSGKKNRSYSRVEISLFGVIRDLWTYIWEEISVLFLVKKSSYTHVSDFEWFRNYDHWKFIIKDKDCVNGLE